MKLKKISALLLACAMALSLAACNGAEVKWIAKVNDEQVPSGIYLLCMMDAYTEAETKAEDKEKDVLSQSIDGTSARQWITEQTDKNFRRYVAVEMKAKEQNIVLTDAENAYIMQQIQYQLQFMGTLYEDNSISTDSVLLQLQNRYKESMLFSAQYGANGTTPIAEDELLQKFYDSYYKTMYITMSLTDKEGQPMDEAGKQKVMDKANEVLAKATAEGAVYQDVILAYENEQSAAKGEEAGTVHAHDASSHISFVPKNDESYTTEFKAEVEKMQVGEVKIITSGTVVYMLQKLENNTPADMESRRSEMMKTLKGDEFEAALAADAAGVTVDYNAAAKKLYTPDKLKMG